jgi:hypothetical protein
VKSIVKDPLTHFLLAGLALFAAYAALNPGSGDDEDMSRIVVDRPALLEFIQFRSKRFEPGYAAAVLDAMGPEERDRLIDDYVREEALYREARALGLDRTDYVIKRRLVQTVEFVAGNATEPSAPDEASLRRYYDEHRDAYASPPSVTFTHVYLDPSRDARPVEERARDMLATLNARHVAFTDAPGWGDRFAYNLNYVGKPRDAVVGHFGDAFAQALFSMQPAEGRWQGPIRSAYGVHLVMLTGKENGKVPPFAEVSDKVAADFMADRQADRRETLIGDMIDHYRVDVQLDPAATKAAAR